MAATPNTIPQVPVADGGPDQAPSPALAPDPRPPPEPTNETFVVQLFDGTSAAFNAKYGITVIQTLLHILNGVNHVDYVTGVGSGDSIVSAFKAFVGSGFDKKIMEGLRNVFMRCTGDQKVILIGYSRGALEACVVATILSLFGIPTVLDIRVDVAKQVYDCYQAGTLFDQLDMLRHTYGCRNIEIKALCCFDIVPTIGIPRSGVFGFLNIIPWGPARSRFDGIIRGNAIQNAFHATAYHESRAPFYPMFLRKHGTTTCNLHNWIFPGVHSHMGKETPSRNRSEDLAIARMLAQLSALNVPMNSIELPGSASSVRQRFPAYQHPNDEAARYDETDKSWAQGSLKPHPSGIMKISRMLGTKRRDPKDFDVPGFALNISFSPAFRARESATGVQDPSMKGYLYENDLDGARYIERRSFPKGDANGDVAIPNREPKSFAIFQMSSTEKNLLGMRRHVR